MTESTEILDYEALLAGMAKEATAVEKPSSSTISCRSGILAYNKNPVPGNKLDCIIIASTHVNMLYKGAWDPDNIANPDCYAYSPDGENMVPHPSVANPLCDNCADCPANKWESQDMFGGKAGRGKACKNQRVLAIIPADTKPEDILTAEVAILKVPVTSVQNWGQYVNKVATLFNRPPLAMITQLGVVPDLKTQFKLTFTNVQPVDKSMLKGLIDRSKLLQPTLEREYDAPEEAPAEVDNGKKKKF